MKALVLSGGSGTRLRPFSHSMPKQLIPVANRPVLDHVIDNIRAIGVTEVGVVVGDWEPAIRTSLGDGARLGVRLTYLHQAEPLGLAHCVLLAKDFLGDEDFVMYLGDNILPDGIAGIAESFRRRRPAADLLVHKVPDPRDFGVVELDQNGLVCRLAEKPQHPRSDLAIIGVYFFTAAIHRAAATIRPSARGEIEITHAIQRLVDEGAEVRATEYGGYWKDTGRVEDVLECNRHLLERQTTRIAGTVDRASILHGPVVVAAGARVCRSRIDGPAIVGAGSVVERCHIGPHTSIGSDCEVRDSRLGNSIVLDGATVLGVRGLDGSLVGRSATVRAVPQSLSRHRLIVGDHCQIEVAA